MLLQVERFCVFFWEGLSTTIVIYAILYTFFGLIIDRDLSLKLYLFIFSKFVNNYAL